MTEPLFDQGIADAIKVRASAAMDKKYELVYVDYRDQLTREQVDLLAAGDMESLYDSIQEWESDQRFEQSDRIRKELVEQVIGDYVNDMGGEHIDEDELREDFTYSQAYDEIRWEIEERDESNPIRDLAGNTGMVLMRQVVANEDVALYGNHDAYRVREWLLIEGGALYLDLGQHNIDVIESVIVESMHSTAYSMGMLVYAIDASLLYDTLGCEYVEIVNPYLYLGNYYNGDGFCSEEPLHGIFRVKRSELTTDRGAAGYGWDEVAGVVTSFYAAELRPVEPTAVGN